ncbi:hypothetical protein K432DRAFT_82853 [Lepidopterella palustris CBS 459.81]|uniref:Uncharacterized protein n=1 Tax=Lepidopterella palustris CBS 459.81 TaxID=1314670 RepID=A0A8E2E7M7_9PEZI|nr:hypothetical protein K432DRAFT_82853 [Lepidopterella palustris CBS 459.81]
MAYSCHLSCYINFLVFLFAFYFLDFRCHSPMNRLHWLVGEADQSPQPRYARL